VPDAGSPPLELNVWIAVEGARDLVLGLDASSLAANESAFHRAANARAPAQRYEIQQHEVTWGELEPWLDAHGETLPLLGEERPAWLPPSAGERARFPATGIAWRIAHAYCRSIGGSLPSEEEWELAARGPSLSRYAWGDALADSERTNIGPRAGAHPLPVMSHDQDRTPGPSDRAIWDLMGNAREWTRDLWRDNADLSTPEFVQAAGLTFRAVRGLPLASASRWLPPEAAPAAHRIPLCATGACPEGTDAIRMDVGFRCARESR
jgi:formylglycine-generating enzyme required for sulfatase activity